MASEDIDLARYDRQLYVIGLEAMKKMKGASILISGMGGLGVEIAKNIVLAGIEKVTIQDTKEAKLEDLAAQFYIKEDQLGQNRAFACKDQLVALNSYVTLNATDHELDDDFLSQFDVVCVTEARPFTEILRISQFCHKNNKKFILCDCRGVFAFLFDDFGANFIVNDPKGEQTSRFLIAHITHDEKGMVTIAEDETHNLEDGDLVMFEEVEGMTELNGKAFPVTVKDSRHFFIGDTSKFGEYTCQHTSGYGNQQFPHLKLDFNDFETFLKQPEIVDFDFCTFGRDRQVLLAFIAYMKSLDSKKPFQEEAKLVNAEYKFVEEMDARVFQLFDTQKDTIIMPTVSAIGGIAGQEIMKSVTGKFKPIYQFLGIGYIESVPAEVKTTLHKDRFDAYRICFGDELFDKMQGLKYFMIGAGALGCELLKNWAMMGVSSAHGGKVYLTDMDTVELSNLTRQFLFRTSDIGHLKSESAAKAVQAMQPNFTVEAHSNKVGPETTNIYNDAFYQSLDGICNALDNVEARLFTDRMSVFYHKPLLESGTLGPKAHYQMIIPGLTENYAAMNDPHDKGIPQCTIHNFPSNIDHCCMWSKTKFIELFDQAPNGVNQFLSDPNYVDNMIKSSPLELESALRNSLEMLKNPPKTFEDCVHWARLRFEEFFVYAIKDLQHCYPKDYVNETGIPFWGGSKRYPTAAVYNPKDPNHAQFIESASMLYGKLFGIKAQPNAAEIAATFKVPEWIPSDKKISLDEKKENETPEIPIGIEDAIEVLLKELEPYKKSNLLHREEFEKDDDSNGHMDFVAAAANLRAINYEIKPQTKLEIKRIAGNIIPAIATTTAMICGFVCLEMYKVHAIKPLPLTDFRSGFISLGSSYFALTEPMEPMKKKCKANGLEFTVWDKIVIEGDLTLKEVIKKAEEITKLHVFAVAFDKFQLYMSFITNEATKRRMNMKITDIIVKEFHFEPLNDGQYYVPLVISLEDDNGDAIEEDYPEFYLKVK